MPVQQSRVPPERLRVRVIKRKHLVDSWSGLTNPDVPDGELTDVFSMCFVSVLHVCKGGDGEGLYGQVTVQRSVRLDCVQDQPCTIKQQGPGGRFKGEITAHTQTKDCCRNAQLPSSLSSPCLQMMHLNT